ncbi:Mitotic-spindle organizing protein 1 [Grifola frondosa]|uniref:Mitotic-spindle organizing protein 1 n=1 Tax=Grifola frondosa TaxID=5627 RepID=A0A1C7MAE5_GRIFR|nr:Mitotic-spindle organizing protein 1 [Grifola frondosa]
MGNDRVRQLRCDINQATKRSSGSNGVISGMSTREADRNAAAQQTLDTLSDISQLLNTQLDRETLATCVGMIESGVNPEALAAVIQELRRENAALNAQPVSNGR